MQLQGLLNTVLRRIRKNAVASALIALAAAFLLGLYAFRGVIFISHQDGNPPPRVTPGAPTLRHPLTGIPVESAVGYPRVWSIMIDHAADAWPQAGVDKAFLVIEAPVEAGIPRLQAFFSEETPVAKIGPVRSARPYFIDWADEFDALYAHVGGSDDALKKLASSGTLDLNQFSNGSTFWRAKDRLAPHNVYTSTDLLRSAWDRLTAARKTPTEVSYGSWLFKDGTALPPDPGISPTIRFTAENYRVRWAYDSQTNRYHRYQMGLPFSMENGDEVLADNVAVMITNMSVLDSIGHREVRTLGEGEAVIFRDGEVIQGTWKKPSASERLRFYDSKGELVMNAGTTWIEVVPGRETVTF